MSDYRREQKKVISPNPETGEYDFFDEHDIRHNLQDECLGSADIQTKHSLYCGCYGEIGGRCSEPGCGKVSCIRCHQHCGGTVNQRPEGCGKSLCRNHAVSFRLPEGQTIVFCNKCRNTLSRKLRWQSVGRFFLNPFFKMEEHPDE